MEQLRILRCLLLSFEAVLGLKINLLKSVIVPIGEVEDVEGLSRMLGCGVESLPLTSLGLPLGDPYKNSSIWNKVTEKMESKLAGWKRLYLSKGGRLTPIKSMLSNIPTYYPSLFQIPQRVMKRIEKIQRDFLWGGVGDDSRFGKLVQGLHKYGGRGIRVRNLIQFNRALLGKWLWRFANEEDAWWRKLVEVKYDIMRGGWCSKEVGGSYGVGVWKCIRKGWDNFKQHVRYEVGNGSQILLRQDVRCGELPLKNVFPVLFTTDCAKKARVEENMAIVIGVIH